MKNWKLIDFIATLLVFFSSWGITTSVRSGGGMALAFFSMVMLGVACMVKGYLFDKV